MAAQGTIQQLHGMTWSGPASTRKTEAGRAPEVLRAVVRRWEGAVRAWRGADRRVHGLDERREQVRRAVAMLGPRPW